MQVNSATNSTAQSATAASSDSTVATAKKTALGQDDFLKLLAVQFQQQDPMKPMEDTAFIAQMAQFTALDQSSSLLTQVTALSGQQDLATANSYLGHHVTVDNGEGGTVSGDVAGVEITDGVPRLVIGEFTYPVSSVVLVEPAAAPTTTTATSAS